MKRTSTSETKDPESDDMLPEYAFDYRKARPNRFAGRAEKKKVAVVLDEDVAEVFSTPEAVNKALRALIEAMPRSTAR